MEIFTLTQNDTNTFQNIDLSTFFRKLIKIIALYNCVNNKMLKHDWLLTALIYPLIGCLRSKLSDLARPITTFVIGQAKSDSEATNKNEALHATTQ